VRRLGRTSKIAIIAAVIVVAVMAAFFLLGEPYRKSFQQVIPSLAPPQPQLPPTPSPTPPDTPTSPPSSPPSRVGSAPVSPLDLQLKKLAQGNIAFNNPEKMRVGETAEIEAKLAVTIPADELMGLLNAAGKRESASLEVSDHMQATLTGGAAFDVSPAGPQSQWISKDAPTTWHWLVTPKLTGPQFLTLSVDAIITINGDKDTRNITTLTRSIEVDVAHPHNEEEWVAWIKDQGEAFGWGWGALAAVIAVVTGFWRRIRGWVRSRQDQSGSKGGDGNKD
jgi:hypothetical protein